MPPRIELALLKARRLRVIHGEWHSDWWRWQIGADPRVFMPLPKRQRHHLRFHRIVAKIEAEELKLAEQPLGYTRDLARRLLQ